MFEEIVQDLQKVRRERALFVTMTDINVLECFNCRSHENKV